MRTETTDEAGGTDSVVLHLAKRNPGADPVPVEELLGDGGAANAITRMRYPTAWIPQPDAILGKNRRMAAEPAARGPQALPRSVGELKMLSQTARLSSCADSSQT